MTKPGQQVNFYQSVPQRCGYLPGRRAVNIVMDPAITPDGSLYTRLVELGFRRSGSRVYRPGCPGCSACIPLRIPVARFVADRSQRRAWRRHAHWVAHERPAAFDEEHYRLYCRYLEARHPDGGMAAPTPEDYLSFLAAPGVETRFIEFREEGRCVAVAATDVLESGLSAIYTFFEPALPGSPGVYAILWQVRLARALGLDWLYLGYWIGGCRKMRYKIRYRPCELLVDGTWRDAESVVPADVRAPAGRERV